MGVTITTSHPSRRSRALLTRPPKWRKSTKRILWVLALSRAAASTAHFMSDFALARVKDETFWAALTRLGRAPWHAFYACNCTVADNMAPVMYRNRNQKPTSQLRKK